VDWLVILDNDHGDCALNTEPFLDLSSYLAAQHSEDPQKFFNALEGTTQQIVKAQNIIEKMLKQ
jgi:hypothetical protein